MLVKIVARAGDEVLERLASDPDVIPKGGTSYVETLFFHPRGVYGAPDLYAIRVWGERDEKAKLVHLGHDVRNQREKEVETGKKDDLLYKLMNLGYVPLGSYPVSEAFFRYRDFHVKYTDVEGVGAFITVEREMKEEDTNYFATKQKQAVEFLTAHGVHPDDILDVDVRGLLLYALAGSDFKK